MLVVGRRRDKTIGTGAGDAAVSWEPTGVIGRIDAVHAAWHHKPTGFIPAIIFIRCLRQRTGGEHENRRKNKLNLGRHCCIFPSRSRPARLGNNAVARRHPLTFSSGETKLEFGASYADGSIPPPSDQPLEHRLLELVKLRASQINGCAHCIDMHSKELRADGESEQRLYLLDSWRESPFYTERERAALAWTEAVTLVSEGHVPEDVYEAARAQFNEQELANLTIALVAINGANRLNIAFRTVPGSHQPAPRRTGE